MLSDLFGAFILMGYYLVVCILLPTLIRALDVLPKEVIRKMQHVAYSMSVFLLLRLFSAWYWAIASAFLLVLLGYPLLLAVERSPQYRKLFVDRTQKGGELRKQLLYVQISFAILIFVFWGLLGVSWRYVVAVAVMAWGFGDAAAALVGKAYGKRHILNRYIESAKTFEGTSAMAVTAALALFFTLWLYAGKSWYMSLVIAVVVAPICALVELFSKRGTDTLTVPLSAALAIVPIAFLLSLAGW